MPQAMPMQSNQAVADGTSKIQNDYKPGQSLDDQKAAAKANLDKVAEDTKAKINGDATLTSAEKAAQSAAVDADKAAVKRQLMPQAMPMQSTKQ
ncbi:hypothetical protein AKUH4B406M_14430 [Apilactobacillus kunkeei]|nr:hypothetical protein AKUH4B406M_14430 [Apilactobacillus kunkeei]